MGAATIEVLCERTIAHHLSVIERFGEETGLVRDSFPILYFGDLDRYSQSTLKIVTAGLNPSDIEFSEDRFGISHTNSMKPSRLLEAFNNYFKNNPYNGWFDQSFESLLQPLSASFYGECHPKVAPRWWRPQPNIALHTDICSPLATRPTWSKLRNKELKDELQKMGFSFWLGLINVLQPHLILISVGREFMRPLEPLNWQSLRPFDTCTENHEMRIADLENSKIVWGRPQIKPFFHFSLEQRELTAKTILKHIDVNS